jgi:cytochrome c oxidase subunit II
MTKGGSQVIGKLLRGFGMLAALPALLPGLAAAQEAAPAEPLFHHSNPGQIALQEPVTPIMDSIIVFHDGLLLWTAGLITLFVLALLVIVMVRFNAKANPVPSTNTHNTLIEILWTVVPILILVVIAVPSFGVLSDQLTIPDGQRKYLGANIFSFGDVEVPAASMTVKVTGSTWFWTYEYVDQGERFDSNILPESDRQTLKPNQPRLLAVDNELVVPVNTTVRVQVTASEVIHAFAVPSFGVKIDAVPGRLNETWFNARKTGLYYGQCSELCGKDHAFMPIAVRVVTEEEFAAWMTALQAGNVGDANATLPPIT